MWLDKAGHDAEVGLHVAPIDPDGRTRRRLTQEGQLLRREGVVIDDLNALDDVRAQHPDQLLVRIGSMRTSAVQDDELRMWDEGEFLQQPGDDALIGRG